MSGSAEGEQRGLGVRPFEGLSRAACGSQAREKGSNMCIQEEKCVYAC